jgi:integrase
MPYARLPESLDQSSAPRRPFTKQELQDFFGHADDQVSLIANSRRKGWLPAYRDAVMFKLAYSYGLRFNELRHLQTVDVSRNPHAREFGRYGAVTLRYGKAKKGSSPKRRTVLTVFEWTPETIVDWLNHGQPNIPQPIIQRLRELGINLQGSRNTGLQQLVSEVPTPLVAEMLGCSDQVAQRHAELAGASWSMYATSRKGKNSSKYS